MPFNDKIAEAERRVERWLTAELARHSAAPERLLAAMRHASLGGGKRFRPFLVIACAGVFGVAPEAARGAAVALELVHGYSLVHDDLPAMDNDALRRGQPTVWKAFDEWTAILAGDALLTLAFEVLADPAAAPDPNVRTALVLALARAAGAAGMVGGQCLDLEAEKLGTPARPTVGHIARLQAMKTGALIACACECGAILGRADKGQRMALERYGKTLGLAFQISDDLLDAQGDAAVVGKAVAKDAAAGKATWVALLGIDGARRKLVETEAEAIAAIAQFGAAAAVLEEAARFLSRREK